MRVSWIVAGLATLWPFGCSCPSSESAPPERPANVPAGLREDSRKACEHQRAWPKAIYQQCTKCVSLSAAPACGCPKDTKEYSAKCYKEFLAKRDDKSCEEVFKCTHKCLRPDCECFARCYEGHDQCAKLAANLEGCIAEICDPFCR